MKVDIRRDRRYGGIIPLVALSIVGLLSVIALAVDIGLVAIARGQCQNAADVGATAGVRVLNGYLSENNNYSAVVPTVLSAVGQNSVLGQPISPNQVRTDIGSYVYDYNQQRFLPYYTSRPNDANWSLVRVRVTYRGSTHFARIFGVNSFDAQATATAVHRPRDIAFIVDFSGSMRFASLIGIPYSGVRQASGHNPNSGTNNPESVFPRFGHYSSSEAKLQRSTHTIMGDTLYELCNFTEASAANNFRPPVVLDFYQHSSGQNAQLAFSSAGNGDSEGFVAGDKPWRTNFNTGSSYAQTFAQIVNLTNITNSLTRHSWELTGYGNQFQGYTLGPRYWGKTFFIWPPDPRGPMNLANIMDNGSRDWRRRFFLRSDGVTPVNDNILLWETNGVWKLPRSGSTENYRINYRAILHWIRNVGPNPFPPRLRAGRIRYYDRIPDPNDSTLNTRWWNTFPLADPSERFWKEYIDYVLGLRQTGANSWEYIGPYIGYGDDFSWGTIRITPLSNLTGNPLPYMRYDDNPLRPRLRFWFGPMTMVDFLGNYNMGSRTSNTAHWWWPGTVHEYPLYACKLGVRAALQDMERNHPNDHVSLIFFSVPMYNSSSWQNGYRFNRVRAPLGRDYRRMIDMLWFPPYTIENPGTEISMYDAYNNLEVPRAQGGTCYAMGLMLAYNQFSNHPSLRNFNPPPAPVGDAGGLGRRGAQKLIIFETDGEPNWTASASFVNGGPYNSYYRIRFNSANLSASEFPSVSSYSNNHPTVTSQIFEICRQLAALDTANPPGYSTRRKPLLIHCIGFGQVFSPINPTFSVAVNTLAQMETIGNIPPDQRINAVNWKIINGTDEQIAEGLRTAIMRILQDGRQVSLIE
ncbi:MAG: pilus assembly protein TadG-related protein [Gemmatales bacterium]|nr:pilus assembly protein TadG-related protein [Gemmatales bacterium]MDW8174559.1 pilus assembly protein TadG-related protein [Gemmatales bacterium]